MKRGFLAVIFIGVAISVSGCGKREDVSSDEVFSVDDIAEIDMDVSSWDVRVLASSDDGIHVEHEGKVGDKDSVQVQQEDDKLLIQQHAAAKIWQRGFLLAGKVRSRSISRQRMLSPWISPMVPVIWSWKRSISLIFPWITMLGMCLCPV